MAPTSCCSISQCKRNTVNVLTQCFHYITVAPYINCLTCKNLLDVKDAARIKTNARSNVHVQVPMTSNTDA